MLDYAPPYLFPPFRASPPCSSFPPSLVRLRSCVCVCVCSFFSRLMRERLVLAPTLAWGSTTALCFFVSMFVFAF